MRQNELSLQQAATCNLQAITSRAASSGEFELKQKGGAT